MQNEFSMSMSHSLAAWRRQSSLLRKPRRRPSNVNQFFAHGARIVQRQLIIKYSLPFVLDAVNSEALRAGIMEQVIKI